MLNWFLAVGGGVGGGGGGQWYSTGEASAGAGRVLLAVIECKLLCPRPAAIFEDVRTVVVLKQHLMDPWFSAL